MSELSRNDLLSQFTKKIIKQSKEIEQKRIDEINSCQHLFVKVREYDSEFYGDVDLSLVECVHCSVTNKFQDLEGILARYRSSFDYDNFFKRNIPNVEYRDVTIETEMMNKIQRENKNLQLMSNNVIKSLHPNVLYQLAKVIKENADNTELFDIMQELNDLETEEEKVNIAKLRDAMELLIRYNELHRPKKKIK